LDNFQEKQRPEVLFESRKDVALDLVDGKAWLTLFCRRVAWLLPVQERRRSRRFSGGCLGKHVVPHFLREWEKGGRYTWWQPSLIHCPVNAMYGGAAGGRPSGIRGKSEPSKGAPPLSALTRFEFLPRSGPGGAMSGWSRTDSPTNPARGRFQNRPPPPWP